MRSAHGLELMIGRFEVRWPTHLRESLRPLPAEPKSACYIASRFDGAWARL